MNDLYINLWKQFPPHLNCVVSVVKQWPKGSFTKDAASQRYAKQDTAFTVNTLSLSSSSKLK